MAWMEAQPDHRGYRVGAVLAARAWARALRPAVGASELGDLGLI